MLHVYSEFGESIIFIIYSTYCVYIDSQVQKKKKKIRNVFGLPKIASFL